MPNWIWQPAREWIEQTNVHRFMRRLGFDSREKFLAFSRDEIETFWDLMVQETGIEWFQLYDQVLDTTRGVEWARWFLGGKLNITANCLDRHASSGRIAILSESEDETSRSVTFAELAEQVNGLASQLRSFGLKQGDRVALCMPMVPEVVAILYACFKLGLIAVPIFAGFGPAAIASRLADSGARVVFTATHLRRRGRIITLKEKVDRALEEPNAVEKVMVLSDIPRAAPIATEPLDSEAPALILYTSGTTGRPKGTVHTHAGCLAQMTKEIHLAFDHKPGDRFFWLSDIGWMMGPWTIIGNHNFGGTIFMYDGAPDYPTPDRMWRMIERHGITTFGISPTAVRLLMRAPMSYEMPSLRLLGSTGEPWDDASYTWFFENVGKRRCPIINISGGTEIVGCFLFPLPTQPLKSCTLGGPAPGMAAEVVDENGNPVRGRMGYLVCTKPAPSMTRGIWGDPERYIETYWSRWPGVWNHGDWASVDEDGYWFLHGRADESMNVAGRKVGPAEVEDALISHPAVSEAAVIGVPDELTGEAIVGFVVLSSGNEQLLSEISAHLMETLGPTFRPRALHAVTELPKTQSGKVVRRLIRRKYLGKSLGDVSTVANPGALDQIGASA